MPMPLEAVVQFVTQLNVAVSSNVSAKELADNFKSNYTKQDIGQILQAIEIKKFIESIRACASTSQLELATGKGKRFLTTVWKILEEYTKEETLEK
jgi:hypothetical protein